ncbi:MAG: metallophosphoesterase family protein, partial [Planctomycetota bacterium]|nr:metallophosphoesterase family protein [Planctomycetota bacterium]
MKIAIMSDSHDNIWKLEAALEKAAGSDAIIHCGDLCSPFIIDRLGRLSNEKPVHVVWGNNEGD